MSGKYFAAPCPACGRIFALEPGRAGGYACWHCKAAYPNSKALESELVLANIRAGNFQRDFNSFLLSDAWKKPKQEANHA